MDNKSIVEESAEVVYGNTLIAQFMELDFREGDKYDNPTAHNPIGKLVLHYPKNEHGLRLLPTEVIYHKSYDWLLPVLFKFRDLVITDESLFMQHDYWMNKIVEAFKYGDVDDVPYKAFVRLVEAISWHRQQNKQ